MFDLGWTELLLIGIVALIVVGPKDLPGLFRNVGRFVGKARGMAREFSRAMEEAADESGVKDATASFRSATDGFKNMSNPAGYARKKLTEATDLAGRDPDSETGRLSEDRAEAARKIHTATAERAAARHDREAAAARDAADTTPVGAAPPADPAPGASAVEAVPEADSAPARKPGPGGDGTA